MKLETLNLVTLLQGREVTSALITSFTLDEALLVALGREANLPPDQTRVLFDLTRFNGFAQPRAFRKWLHPRTMKESTSLTVSLPPVWHPKLAAFRFKNEPPCLFISSANLAPADQFHDANVSVTLSVSEAAMRKLDRWAKDPAPEPTVLAVIRRRKPTKLVVSDRPTWWHFQKMRAEHAGDREDWIVASPFCSAGVVQKFHSPEIEQTIELFLLNQGVAKSLCRLKSGFKIATVNTPTKNGRFHQKIVAVRIRKKQKVTVILYVGSANFTRRGFFGTEGRAGNTEAGALFVGSAELWTLARSLAEFGIDEWRTKTVEFGSEKPEDSHIELGDDESNESTELLEQMLAARLDVKRGSIALRRGKDRKPIALQSVSVIIDAQKPRKLRPGQRIQIRNAHSVSVQGDFQIEAPLPPWFPAPTRQSVQFELPSLAKEVEPKVFHPGADELRRLLGMNIASDEIGNSEREHEELERSTCPAEDVRFPWPEWSQFEQTRTTAQRNAWLTQVTKSERAPAFWKHAAEALLR